MATEKVSLTLDERLVEQARAVVGQRSLSAYVNEALSRQLQRDRIVTYLNEMDREFGPVAANVTEEVRRSWPADAQKRRRSA